MKSRSSRPARHRTDAQPLRATAGRVLAAVLAASIGLSAPIPVFAQKAARESREPVTLNFVNAEIEAVARAMAVISNRQIVVDPRVKGTMTLYSEQPLTPREAFLNFLAGLRGLGFAVVEVAGLLKIVPEAEAKLQTGTVSVDAVSRTGDQVVTQIFRLQHENVNNMVTVLRPLISPNNTINANPGNNSLVITDYADNLKRIAKIIATMDVPSTTDVEVVTLRHAVAADIVQLVQRFADASASTAGAAPGAGSSGVQVQADARSNSLLIRAPNPTRLAQVRSVIDKLDRPNANGSAAGNIYVVYLKNADAVRLAAVLRAAYGALGGTGTQAGGGGGTTGAQASPLQQNNQATGANASGLSAQATAPIAAAAGPSTGGFIQADPATNSLVISAPEPVYRQLRAVIEQLDARRAQVYIESMIVKMDATEAAQFGFQWQNLTGSKGDSSLVGAGTNFNSAGGNILTLSQTIAQGTAGLAKATADAVGTGLNLAIAKKVGSFYTLGALAQFLEANSGANILSTPNLVSLDNEEAKIVIGQNVPFVTGTFTNTGTGTGTTNPFQTVERKDVGLTLRVKPQIGENGTVRMTIYQENSSVVSSAGNNGPTTDKSAIETNVVVDDGSIMVLGGLLKDEYQGAEDRVPGLSRIPIVGNLFRSENRKRVKTNLLVFLRPVVMRTQADADSLSMDRYDAIRARQQNNQPLPSSLVPINESAVLPEITRTAPSTSSRPVAPAPSANPSFLPAYSEPPARRQAPTGETPPAAAPIAPAPKAVPNRAPARTPAPAPVPAPTPTPAPAPALAPATAPMSVPASQQEPPPAATQPLPEYMRPITPPSNPAR